MTNEAQSTNDEEALSLRSSFGAFVIPPIRLIRLIRGQNHLFVEIARRPRRGFQERVIHILLVDRFDWYRAPDLDRFLVLRLDRDRFPDLGWRIVLPFWLARSCAWRLCGSHLAVTLLQSRWPRCRPFDCRLFPLSAAEPARVSASA